MSNRGFTLIELMITVSIVGILAMVAVPAYRKHMTDTRQAEAKALLMENAHFMERWYAEKGTYKNKDASPDQWPSLPHVRSPRDGEGSKLYDLAFTSKVENAKEGSYRIKATPVDSTGVTGDEFVEINENGNVRVCRSLGGQKVACR